MQGDHRTRAARVLEHDGDQAVPESLDLTAVQRLYGCARIEPCQKQALRFEDVANPGDDPLIEHGVAERAIFGVPKPLPCPVSIEFGVQDVGAE